VGTIDNGEGREINAGTGKDKPDVAEGGENTIGSRLVSRNGTRMARPENEP